MQQLSGLDATFLNLETAYAPLHISGLAIYDQSSAPGEQVTFKGILANIESRLHLARCFRQKLVRVPFGADHPYWIEDGEFDLEFHVRHIALPKPGDWRQLCIQTARIHARPLDLTKPLWEMYVIEGLDGVDGLPHGSFAILTKIHHAAVDGVTGTEITAAIHDTEQDAQPVQSKVRWKPEPVPTSIELALKTAVNNVRQPFRLAGVLSEMAPPAIRALWQRRSERVDGDTGSVPRTRFNTAVSAHRVFEARTFALDRVKQIRKRIDGATVNDVVLTVCAGALRHYLEAHGELPKQSLSAFAPISVRTKDEKGTGGNQVSGMLVTLHTRETDPLRRLEKVHQTTLESKALSGAIGARNLTDLTQFLPGALTGISARLVARTGLMRRVNPIANTVVTNVPGPQIPLYFTGARMVANFGLGLPLDGMGLFHAILSYNGTITIAITGCREQLPDPGFYAECLQRSFDELLQASVDG
jgi:WS/DGAT/MGAT family acyltransferase